MQCANGAWHALLTWQIPLAHATNSPLTWGSTVQSMPHPPQLRGSVRVSMHVPSQLTVVLLQVMPTSAEPRSVTLAASGIVLMSMSMSKASMSSELISKVLMSKDVAESSVDASKCISGELASSLASTSASRLASLGIGISLSSSQPSAGLHHSLSVHVLGSRARKRQIPSAQVASAHSAVSGHALASSELGSHTNWGQNSGAPGWQRSSTQVPAMHAA